MIRKNQGFWTRVNWLILLIVGLLLLWVWQRPDDKVHLVFCDVGQGDAILISWRDKQVLVDGGPDESVLSCLGEKMGFWDRQIEMVVVSHVQADHAAGLMAVLERYEVGQLVVADVVNDTELFWQLRQLVKEKEIEVHVPEAGERWQMGEVKMTVWWPKEKLGNELAWSGETDRSKVLGAQVGVSDVNKWSVVIKGSLGKFDWLLTGDIGKAEERQLVASREWEGEEIEVLKVAHHGSRYSSSQEFLEVVRPKAAVISVGKNSFGHPTKEVLKGLGAVGAKVWRTDNEGTVEIVSDGERWWKK